MRDSLGRRADCSLGGRARWIRAWPGVVGFFLFAIVNALADPLPKGPGKVECPNGDEPITLFTYKPPTYKGGPLFVICHGVQRNAEDYRNFAITLAERF